MVGEKEIRGQLKEKKMGLTHNYVVVSANNCFFKKKGIANIIICNDLNEYKSYNWEGVDNYWIYKT